ncbi:hypothetical protein SASPL_149647 [Salvia splendens]|uniref:Target of rapamycin complex subunit LST8 n=1 Tax=Salvia splendens TaxID=180675 RepID=A0A8X8WBI7_SALSN|nr:hypothetical protein SASPL_149647 [Salvia splendens]
MSMRTALSLYSKVGVQLASILNCDVGWKLGDPLAVQTMTNFVPLHKLQAHDQYILKCLLSPELCEPNRYLATASSDNTVKIWNADDFTLEKTLVGHQRWVWDCVFSVDGAFLITASSDSTALPLLGCTLIESLTMIAF